MIDGNNAPNTDDTSKSILKVHKSRGHKRQHTKGNFSKCDDKTEVANGFESASGQLSAMQRRISCLEAMIKKWPNDKKELSNYVSLASKIIDSSDDSSTAVDDSSIEITTLEELERHFSENCYNNRDSSSIISSIFDAYMPDSEPQSPFTPEFDDELMQDAIEHIDYEIQQLQIRKYPEPCPPPSPPPRAAEHTLKAHHHHVRFDTSEAATTTTTSYVDLRTSLLTHKGHHHLNAHRVRDSVTLRKSQMTYASETEHDQACLNAISNAGVTSSEYSSRTTHCNH